MVSQIRRGILDMIGAARPSIADPFPAAKIEEGRLDDIRECIGCNICVSGDFTMTPMRCTQNPTMGEEWRRGWHPEIVSGKASDDSVLVVAPARPGSNARAPSAARLRGASRRGHRGARRPRHARIAAAGPRGLGARARSSPAAA